MLCEPASPDLRAQVPWGAGGSGAWLASGRSTGPCWRLRGWGPAPPTGLSPSVLGALLVFLGTENLNQVIQPPWEAAGQAGWEACGAGWGRPLRHRRDSDHSPQAFCSQDSALCGRLSPCLVAVIVSWGQSAPPPRGAGRNCRPGLCRRPESAEGQKTQKLHVTNICHPC